MIKIENRISKIRLGKNGNEKADCKNLSSKSITIGLSASKTSSANYPYMYNDSQKDPTISIMLYLLNIDFIILFTTTR